VPYLENLIRHSGYANYCVERMKQARKRVTREPVYLVATE
jgi:hypothetical protein